jgi:hypothetical protein
MQSRSQLRNFFALMTSAALLCACSTTPVSAWQRGNLAKKQMQRDSSGLHSNSTPTHRRKVPPAAIQWAAVAVVVTEHRLTARQRSMEKYRA